MTQLDGTPDADLREAIFRYSLEEASPAMREHIQHLCRCWLAYNDEYFGGELAPIVLAFEEPGHTTCYGEYSSVSMFGGSGQIMIRPSLLAGTLQHFRKGNKNKEGMRRFTEHVLLHEMIHQWQDEVNGTPPEEHHNYGGHGATFSAKANEIGARLGFPPVRRRNKKSHSGQTAHLPNPSQWPHNVCPQDYYLGAYVPSSQDEEAKLLEHLSIVLRRHGIEKVRRTTDEVWQAIEEARTAARASRVINTSVVDEHMISRIHIPTARKSSEPYEEPAVVYIGGPCNRGPYNFAKSVWHNPYNKPFRRGEISREQSVALFREHMLESEGLLHKLGEVDAGTIFGCWCRLDELCHGDVLIELWKRIRRGILLQ